MGMLRPECTNLTRMFLPGRSGATSINTSSFRIMDSSMTGEADTGLVPDESEILVAVCANGDVSGMVNTSFRSSNDSRGAV